MGRAKTALAVRTRAGYAAPPKTPRFPRSSESFFLLLALSVLLTTSAVYSEDSVYPHVESGIETRITNRRYVSHIVYEVRDGDEVAKYGPHFVTILTTHPGVWAFHATSHALHHPCGSRARCLKVLRKLDDFLRTGWNIGLRVEGSIVREIVYYPAR